MRKGGSRAHHVVRSLGIAHARHRGARRPIRSPTPRRSCRCRGRRRRRCRGGGRRPSRRRGRPRHRGARGHGRSHRPSRGGCRRRRTGHDREVGGEAEVVEHPLGGGLRLGRGDGEGHPECPDRRASPARRRRGGCRTDRDLVDVAVGGDHGRHVLAAHRCRAARCRTADRSPVAAPPGPAPPSRPCRSPRASRRCRAPTSRACRRDRTGRRRGSPVGAARRQPGRRRGDLGEHVRERVRRRVRDRRHGDVAVVRGRTAR